MGYQRNSEAIEAKSQLDGLYVIRTSTQSQTLSAEAAVLAYKSLIHVEQAFRYMKSVDLKIRPIFHRLEHRVRAHVFLCCLAYHIEWHMRQALAPILFEEDNPVEAQQLRSSIVDSAKRSLSARHKAARKLTAECFPVHSFHSLLADLASLVRNTIQPTQTGIPCFDKLTQPSPLQKKVFSLLQVPF